MQVVSRPIAPAVALLEEWHPCEPSGESGRWSRVLIFRDDILDTHVLQLLAKLLHHVDGT